MDNDNNNSNNNQKYDPITGQPILPEPLPPEQYVQPQQPVQQQYQPQQYVQQPQQPQQPQQVHPDNFDPTCKKICWASLICWIVGRFGGLGSVVTLLGYDGTFNSESAVAALFGLATIASYVLMIYARIKYPHSKFAKILMWVYIAVFILGIVFVVLCFFIIIYTIRTLCGGFAIPG